MKYYKRKIGKLIVSLIVTLAIISGSFYYGLSNYVSYAQANETEVTVPDEPEISGGGSSQDTDEVVISGGGDGVQTNEPQADETLPEVQNKEANQASEEMQKDEESLELPKNKASETEEENMELLSVGRGSLTGDISSIVKMRLNDLYLEGENGKKYIIQGGDKPKNSQEQLSELKVGETLHLDYLWDIIYDKDKGINQIQYIKQGNYFQVELPGYKVFENFQMLSQEVFVKKEDGTNTTFKLGEYSLVNEVGKRYLRLTMTEENDYYQENVLASITGGNPQLTFKVKKVSDEQTIHIPGLDEAVSADVTITIVQEPPNGGGGNTQPKPKPNPIPEDNGGYKDPPGSLKKESGQNKWVGKDKIRWWLHINRDAAYDMFSDNFNSSANPRKNLVVTDDISTMTSDNSNATFKLDSDSVIIYLDMLKPIIKDGQVTGFSHGPVFTRWIYKNDGSLSRLDSYFDSKVVVDNNKLEVQFGDIPNTNNTYRKAFGDSEASIKVLDDFLKDPVINNQKVDANGDIVDGEPTAEEYWEKVDEYKAKLKNTGGKDFTDLMIDKVTAGRITVNQAKIMKKTYWDSNMPIMHYTVQFDTEFRGMQVGDKATNTAYLKSDEIKESYTDDQIINEVYVTDNPKTRTPEVDIVINKKWQDASGKAMDDAPIDKISVQLYQDEKPYRGPVEIGKDNSWTHTFEKLPGYKSQGVLYKYTVKEVTKVEGYDFEIKEADTGSTITFTITNKQLPPTVPPTTPPTPPSNPYIPPYIPPTPDIIIPPTPTPLTPPDIPDEEIILPDEDVIIDDDDVVKTDFDEEDEVMEDDVPLANIPKTGAFHSLLPLVGISLLSLIMLFKFRPKK